MTRRDKGTGSIYADTTRGGYRAKVTIDGKQYVRRGKTRAEVKDKLNALFRDHARGELAQNYTMSVAEVVDRYIERSVPNRRGGSLSPTALARYRWAAEHIKAAIGTKRAAKLTTRDVEAMLDRLAARPLSRDSLVKIRSLLRAALDSAVRRGEIVRNVADPAELPGTTAAAIERLSLSPDMAERLFAGLDDERNGAMYAMSLLLGLRPGEAAGLYWDDLDGYIVNVTRARQTDERGHAAIVDRLKTKQAKRTLEMPDRLVDMLAQHRVRQAEDRLAAATWVNPDLVFASTVGTPIAATAARKQLDEICARLDVTIDDPASGPRAPVPYELRHTAASRLVDAGYPLEVVAAMLGLSSPRVLMDHYLHRLRPTVSAARDADALLVKQA